MTKDAAILAEIRRLLFAEHWKRGTIATQLGVHYDVVERAIGPLGPRAGGAKKESLLLRRYVAFIDEILATYPRLRATRIDDMIRKRGYEGSLRTVRRYVHTARPLPKNEAF